MFEGLNRLVVVALIGGVVLAAPSAALACNGGSASAVNVYRECLPTGGGDKPTTSSPTTKPAHVSSRTQQALNKAGKDKNRLLTLVRGYGQSKHLMGPSGPSRTANTTSPSALGSAFDLGSGPTALLVALAATALLLLGTTGFRGYRRWHRS